MSGILIVAEHTRGVLADISTDLIGAALAVKDKLGGPLRVLIVGEQPHDFAAVLNRPGVDEILLTQTDNAHFDAAVYEEAVIAAAVSHEPALILISHSASGTSFAAAVAVRLGSGFAADVFALDVTDAGVRATRSGFGNKVNVELDFPGKPVVVLTIRGATFKAPEGAGSAKLTPLTVALEGISGRYQHQGFQEAPSSDVDIGKAEFILSIGRGIQDEKNVPRFAALAEKLGATLGCSRPVADSGWLPKPHQVGLTGKVAGNCKLYLALGISGAVQHQHGMKHVETIIAVNTDANAPIYNIATYGCTLDVFEFAAALERAA
ncbi:electron transfer flavoprotein subunit alpha [Betaproteobacteria bacterium]|nr:electron transfer flavoprotein subunit alpha [Betaproteobacteria bacterium]GHU32106.1 electron transfer flavoprotein subunit alpha [Betaproteobacteria bacterium]